MKDLRDGGAKETTTQRARSTRTTLKRFRIRKPFLAFNRKDTAANGYSVFFFVAFVIIARADFSDVIRGDLHLLG